jgi:hypothetical protein
MQKAKFQAKELSYSLCLFMLSQWFAKWNHGSYLKAQHPKKSFGSNSCNNNYEKKMMANGCHFDMLAMKAPTSSSLKLLIFSKGDWLAFCYLSKMRNKLSLDVCQETLFGLCNSWPCSHLQHQQDNNYFSCYTKSFHTPTTYRKPSKLIMVTKKPPMSNFDHPHHCTHWWKIGEFETTMKCNC